MIPISEWMGCLLHLFKFYSIAISARDSRNAYSTGIYMLSKVFTLLEHVQDGTVFQSNAFLYRTFFTVKESNKRLREGKR